MSTYNGEKFLKEQIESILKQDITGEMDLKLVVRDDGSKDGTTQILNQYQEKGMLEWYTGENMRPAKSFWNLLQKAPQADYYAFADQDDYWFVNKLSRAVKQLDIADYRNQPLLYCSSYTATDAQLVPLKVRHEQLNSYSDFAHALLFSIAPGCTFVFNRIARNVLIQYDMNSQYEIIHDWLVHKIITMLGTMIYDKEPSMYYRQHGGNVIGNQPAGLASFVKRVKRFWNTDQNVRSDVAKSLLEVYGSQLHVNSAQYEYLNIVANYKESKQLMWKFVWEKAFKTGTINDWFLFILVVTRKL